MRSHRFVERGEKLKTVPSQAVLFCGFLVAVFLCVALPVKAASPVTANAPHTLRVESASDLLGTDVRKPRFSWQLGAQSGAMQTSYRIRVAHSINDLADSSTLVWDSRKQPFTQTAQIAYDGPALQSRNRYYWQVQTWNERGQVSSWSEPAWWEMGLLEPSDWRSAWISGRLNVDHDWSDLKASFDFTLKGNVLDFLVRAKPAGQTYGEALVWRAEVVDGRSKLAVLRRTYPGGDSFAIVTTVLKTIELPNDLNLRDARHQLVIDLKGDVATTILDGKTIDVMNGLPLLSGTIGVNPFSPPRPPGSPASSGPATTIALLHQVSVDVADSNAFSTRFQQNDNSFSAGLVVTDGLAITSAHLNTDIVLPIAAPAPLLRKTFNVTAPVTSARLYVSAGGFPKLALNGKNFNEPIADGFTAYDKRVLYRTFDVTGLLRQGPNVMGAELGRGWYGLIEPNEWAWHAAPWHAAPAMRLQLEVTYADGRSETIGSDTSWKTMDGPTLHDSIYAGERYDARRLPSGSTAAWTESAFDDQAWRPATPVAGPSGVLDAAEQNPIARIAEIKPVALKEVKPGVWVYDFGRIFAGRLRMSASAPAGATVSLIQTEKLSPDGLVAVYAGGLIDTQLQTDRYTFAGQGTEQWEPSFGYRGFRYVQLEGLPGTPSLDTLKGIVMHSDVRSVAQFESANPLLNKIDAAARATILNNMHGFQTDTPTYEKNGWTGDAQASAEAAAVNFDVGRVWTKWMADFRDAQSSKGEIPEIVPSTPFYGYENTPGWGTVRGPVPSWDAATFILPAQLYASNGDQRILADMYVTQKRLLDYTTSWFTDDYLYRNLNNGLLGEYSLPRAAGGLPRQAPSKVPAPGAVDLVSTVYFFYMSDTLAANARLLGYRDDAQRYAALASRIKQAFNTRYWDAERQVYRVPGTAATDFQQYQNALPLAFGMMPAGSADTIAKHLNDDIVKNDYHLSTTGVFSGRYLLQLLTDHGYVDTAYRVASQTTEPSWGFWIANDISTMLEGWGLNSRSYDHHYWGLISAWFNQGLAGIRPGTPGYGKVIIRPGIPQGLAWAKSTIDTVPGPVTSSWTNENGKIALNVALPNGTSGEVWCPGASGKVTAAKGARFLRAERGYRVYQVSAGTYRFACSVPK